MPACPKPVYPSCSSKLFSTVVTVRLLRPIRISIMGFAFRPGTAMLPKCSIPSNREPNTFLRGTFSSSKNFFHEGLYATRMIGSSIWCCIVSIDRWHLVEREGFEPSRPVLQDSCLAGKRFRPLSHLSLHDSYILTKKALLIKAALGVADDEGVRALGFSEGTANK